MNASLPTLYSALLDADQLHEVLHDIEMLASDISIKARSTEPPADLDEARRQLVSGTARAIQVRYAHGGAAWCDTFTRLPDGIRVHRIQVDSIQQEVCHDRHDAETD